MDIIEKAATKGEELRQGGWNITAIWVSEKVETPSPEDRYILLLKMKEKISKEQMQKVYLQARSIDPWLVLFDFGKGYTGIFPTETITLLSKFLKRRPPTMVWEAASERKSRKAKETLWNKRLSK